MKLSVLGSIKVYLQLVKINSTYFLSPKTDGLDSTGTLKVNSHFRTLCIQTYKHNYHCDM